MICVCLHVQETAFQISAATYNDKYQLDNDIYTAYLQRRCATVNRRTARSFVHVE